MLGLGRSQKFGHSPIFIFSAKWLPRLERQIEKNSESAHEDYRVFISAEPPPSPDQHVIPQGILENSIKITSEPPTGMFANLHAALNNFNQVSLLRGSEEASFILLYYFIKINSKNI